MSDLNYDPYRLQRSDERKRAKVEQMKERLRDKSGKGASREKAQRAPVTSIERVLSNRDKKNSRRKGNRGELDVAVAFSKWSGELVRRTPGSGGWGGAKDFGTTADLVCSNAAFPFHVEVKHREGWVLDDLVTGARKDHDKSIVQWWVQCLDTCPKSEVNGKRSYVTLSKIPLLVFRRNHQPWLVMMQAHVPSVVAPSSATFLLSIDRFDDHDVVVMMLSDFLNHQPVPRGLKNCKERR